ncbi:MAG: DEAD/DEAH box helicase [Lachnospiraceae bacterium]|nr:DEAD/DEAH box helicase [Lachnospiraceae bacterium]
MKKFDELRTGFETAYIDGSVASSVAYRPQFISNNYKEGKKVLSSIEDELLMCDGFKISVAFITKSGITPLLQTLKELEKRNVTGEILTTNYLSFSEPEALTKLNELSNITLKMYDVDASGEGFHTKGYIFKKSEIYSIIIGSSNITGFALTRNREWNTKLISNEEGEMAQEIVAEYNELWNSEYSYSYDEFYEAYNERYNIIKHQRALAKKEDVTSIEKYKLEPNSMQVGFITNLKRIIDSGEKRALLISATGTGKTYASAFAMRELGFKRVLFLVHRGQLAVQSKKSYERVFPKSVKMGLVGAGYSNYDADYVFATVQTLNRDEHLFQYDKDTFDCIVLDEAHHVPADTYQKIMKHFTPKLWLGMTATPDKRDDNIEGKNVYEIFHYQIAYEIRLQQAMEENLLCPFHYFGITDLSIIGDDENSNHDFSVLTSDERVKHIINQANYYGYSGEKVKGLIFCSSIRETEELSSKFNKIVNPATGKPYRTIALNGSASEQERQDAFERLAMNEEDAHDEVTPLDYIFSKEILNEGVDIVEVNQVIMLRPTQSPIVFIQQLGRGLRKAEGKEYVVILDFIGNYNQNFMIPVALSGDRTYNADIIRKYIISGNNTIPGASTIHFDAISRERIFKAIDNIKPKTFKALIREGYTNLKNRLGRIPMLIDFYKNDEVDPLIIIREYKTYYSFVEKMENNDSFFSLSEQEKLTLEYLSKTILSGVRPDELEILRLFQDKTSISYQEVIDSCKDKYGYEITNSKIKAACDVLSGEFVTNSSEFEKFSHIDIVNDNSDSFIERMMSYSQRLAHKDFYEQVEDIIKVGLARYQDKYSHTYKKDCPFVLYEKYSRRDVSLLMGVGKDLSSTMYGMWSDGEDVFIFVTYHKEENTDAEKQYIDGKPDYADEFVDNVIFRWDSQIDKKLDGAYMQKVLNSPRKHLMVQKTDVENNFFYMGEFDIVDVYEDKKMNNRGELKPICKLKVKMHTAVREDLLRYLQSGNDTEEKQI